MARRGRWASRAGFDVGTYSQRVERIAIERFSNDELPLLSDMAAEVRQFFHDWASVLTS